MKPHPPNVRVPTVRVPIGGSTIRGPTGPYGFLCSYEGSAGTLKGSYQLLPPCMEGELGDAEVQVKATGAKSEEQG